MYRIRQLIVNRFAIIVRWVTLHRQIDLVADKNSTRQAFIDNLSMESMNLPTIFRFCDRIFRSCMNLPLLQSSDNLPILFKNWRMMVEPAQCPQLKIDRSTRYLHSANRQPIIRRSAIIVRRVSA